MSMLVAHASKMKSGDVRGMQIHNQRESDPDRCKNQDIDRDRTKLNYDLANQEHINFQQKVKEIIKENYNHEKPIRKDATMLVSVLVSSDKEFFQKLDEQQQRQFFQTAADHLSKMYGKQNVVTATVHMDEATPHMHFQFVPLTADGRLCAKEITNRQGLLNLQKGLPGSLQKAGFEIQAGESKQEKVRHKDSNQWKQEQLQAKGKELQAREAEIDYKEKFLEYRVKSADEKEAEISKKDMNLREKEREWEKIEQQAEDLQKNIVTVNEIDATARQAELKNPWFGEKHVEMSIADYNKLVATAKVGAAKAKKNKELADELTKQSELIEKQTQKIKQVVEKNGILQAEKQINEKILNHPFVKERVPAVKQDIQRQEQEKIKEREIKRTHEHERSRGMSR